MKTAVVTGCAGFIGSHLSERLVDEGWHVVGVDSFTPDYDRGAKEANLERLEHERRFDLAELDLAADDLSGVFRRGTTVFHLAAQFGVRESFGDGFADTVKNNVVATQRVLEAASSGRSRRVVWASCASVYGEAAVLPCREQETPTRPHSPYAVTKRACEDLADIYRRSGLSTVGLRYATVYGPRQRPDMAIRRLCEAMLAGTPFPLYGDGFQSRDFVHVVDAVDAMYRAADTSDAQPLYNVGGGREATLVEVIGILEQLTGSEAQLTVHSALAGDVQRTCVDTERARTGLEWHPAIDLQEGLQGELEWVQTRATSTSAAPGGRARR